MQGARSKIMSLAVLVVLPSFLESAQPKYDVVPRRIEEAWAPAYDQRMWHAGLEGSFVVAVSVLPSGRVHNAEVVESAFQAIDPKIVKYAKKWTFEPAESTTLHRIVFEFRLLAGETEQHDAGTAFVAPATVSIRADRLTPVSVP